MLLTKWTLIALTYINIPYSWGGQTYLGLDCSGMIIKMFHDGGVTLPDMTVKQIYQWALDQKSFYECEPMDEPDCLLFFGKDPETLTHIELSLGEGLMVGASGAGKNSLTMTPEELAIKDARVKIKPISTRRNLFSSIKIGAM